MKMIFLFFFNNMKLEKYVYERDWALLCNSFMSMLRMIVTCVCMSIPTSAVSGMANRKIFEALAIHCPFVVIECCLFTICSRTADFAMNKRNYM